MLENCAVSYRHLPDILHWLIICIVDKEIVRIYIYVMPLLSSLQNTNNSVYYVLTIYIMYQWQYISCSGYVSRQRDEHIARENQVHFQARTIHETVERHARVAETNHARDWNDPSAKLSKEEKETRGIETGTYCFLLFNENLVDAPSHLFKVCPWIRLYVDPLCVSKSKLGWRIELFRQACL